MQNIKLLTEECGGQMEHLVKVVVYITDVRHREQVYRIMGEYLKGVHPVSTGFVVQALARPGWLVECAQFLCVAPLCGVLSNV